MNVRCISSGVALFLCAFALAPLLALAATTPTEDILLGPQTQDVYTTLPKPADTYSPEQTVGKIINILFTFIAIIAVSLVMYGGFQWVTSGGEQEKAKKAQGIFVDAAIGLIVLASVWAVSWLVLKTFAEKVITP